MEFPTGTILQWRNRLQESQGRSDYYWYPIGFKNIVLAILAFNNYPQKASPWALSIDTTKCLIGNDPDWGGGGGEWNRGFFVIGV